jgi:hypothetical protein
MQLRLFYFLNAFSRYHILEYFGLRRQTSGDILKKSFAENMRGHTHMFTCFSMTIDGFRIHDAI